MTVALYKLTDYDYQRLYALATIKDIMQEFGMHAHSESQIRRKYKALGLPPIDRSRRELVRNLGRYCPGTELLKDYESIILDHLTYIRLLEYIRINERIRTHESRY